MTSSNAKIYDGTKVFQGWFKVSKKIRRVSENGNIVLHTYIQHQKDQTAVVSLRILQFL